MNKRAIDPVLVFALLIAFASGMGWTKPKTVIEENKMKKTWIVIGVLLTLAFGLVHHAAAGTKKGDTEISGQLYFFSPSTGDETSTLFGSIGYFLTDRIELTVSSFLFTTGGNTMGSIGPGVEYYFTPEADTIYYVGGSLQLDMSDNDAGGDTDSSFDVHVGAKHFLTERTTVNGTIGHNDAIDGKYLLVGLSYFF
jgi:hypothetical protein